ncbi:CAP domain-containing protein [Pontimicrobium sp. MEBiC06410]
MKNILFCFLFLILPLQFANAQLNASEKEILSKALVKRVNDLRKKLGKHPLKRDIDLVKAAQLHSDYMVKKSSLNHNQVGTDFPKPKDRILHFNKSFISFGENVLYSKPVLDLQQKTGQKEERLCC